MNKIYSKPEALLSLSPPATGQPLPVGGGSPQQRGLPENYQQQVKQFVDNGREILMNDKTRDNILQVLEHYKDDPVNGVKQAALKTIRVIETAAIQQGREIDPLVIAGAGPQIFDRVDAIGQASKLAELSDEEYQIALAAGTQEYLNWALKSGKITKEELMQGAQELEKQDPEQVETFRKTLAKYHGKEPNGQTAASPDSLLGENPPGLTAGIQEVL